MNDLQFIMTLVISLEIGYFNRRDSWWYN
jgi:hypothetical protein